MSNEDLEAKMNKLNKIENDEYLATLKELTNLKRTTNATTTSATKTGNKRIFIEKDDTSRDRKGPNSLLGTKTKEDEKIASKPKPPPVLGLNRFFAVKNT